SAFHIAVRYSCTPCLTALTTSWCGRRDVFVAEASALVATGHGTTASRVEWLLEEAFASSAPKEDFSSAPRAAGVLSTDDPWAAEAPQPRVMAQSDFPSWRTG